MCILIIIFCVVDFLGLNNKLYLLDWDSVLCKKFSFDFVEILLVAADRISVTSTKSDLSPPSSRAKGKACLQNKLRFVLQKCSRSARLKLQRHIDQNLQWKTKPTSTNVYYLTFNNHKP